MAYIGAKVLNQAYYEAYKEALNEDGVLKTLSEVLLKMEDGFYAQAYIDCIMQTNRASYGLFDAFIFLHCHARILTGQVGVFAAKVGNTPLSNSAIEGNNEHLAGLQCPFKAEFIGGTQGDDGWFQWLAPINVAFQSVPGGWAGYRIAREKKPNECAYFEVGYNPGVKMLNCLDRGLEIVRWPYGSEYCFGFVPYSLTVGRGESDFDDLLRTVTVDIENEPLFYVDPFELFKVA
jgi:hypothetical protein